ncbi:uncharacterized protein PV09_09304 [Verruconis gallopava]|uniref:60S ribosomal subunit assembly/export protein LOC1 n=1 Tax=Verruconis gallopava TaxID=253628 RepID=A0A0D1YE52_9PEZI|nr:uncharacterized protein PV09_09304 [Verruconis gallopava]KIV98976.1 hypothetical protein PV09_09304 [Verruconis gallopava]
MAFPLPRKVSETPAHKQPSSKAKSKIAKSNTVVDQVMTQRRVADANKSKHKLLKSHSYSDKQLNLPTLNMVAPVGVQKPKGKKKGKVFVDDAESMRTILAMVSAESDGKIESKMQKFRQMEEIREARRVELEKKEQDKKQKLDELKDGLRKGWKSKSRGIADKLADEGDENVNVKRSSKKKVSFG